MTLNRLRPFTLRWGSHTDTDLRMAIATCVLEHLLEHHFDTLIARVEIAAVASPEFAQTVRACWKTVARGRTESSGEIRPPSGQTPQRLVLLVLKRAPQDAFHIAADPGQPLCRAIGHPDSFEIVRVTSVDSLLGFVPAQ